MQDLPKNGSRESIALIKRMIWLPITALCAVFLATAVLLIWEDSKLSAASIEEQVREAVLAEEALFVNEVFLGQSQALNLRIERIINRLHNYIPHARICLRVIAPSLREPSLSSCPKADSVEYKPIARLAVGKQTLGEVQAQISVAWLANHTLKQLFFAFLLAVGVAMLVIRLLGQRIEKHIVAPLIAKIEQRSHEIGAARVTQMFAHDVRKPFVLIKTMLDQVVDATSWANMQELASKFRPEIDQSLHRIDQMMADILYDQSSNQQLTLQPVSLNRILADTLQKLAEPLPRHLTTSQSLKHQTQAMGVENQIQRVVSNLLLNAIQATPTGGSIWIDTTQNDQWIRVTVGNSGSYIPKDDRQRVFDLFYTRNKTGGTGLGLAICRKIVKAHGGDIWADSSRAAGTEFTLTLPASTTPEVPTDAPVRQGAHAARKRLVIVEDSPFLLELWGRQASAFDISCYATPLQLQECIDSPAWDWQKIAALIVDFYLDDDCSQTGLSLAQAARAAGFRGKILIYSSALIERDIHEQHPDITFIPKDVPPDQILAEHI